MGKPSAEEFSKNGDRFLGRSYAEMDCQKFVEAVMKTVGINEDLAGSNAWYRHMTWVGAPIDCINKFGSIPRGALLFILTHDGKEPEKYKSDKLGNASHIGIKTGRGDGAIHSSKSKGGVVTSVFKDKAIQGGWNMVGLWDRFDYGEQINTILSGPRKPDDKEGITVETATVYAADGGTVNLRRAASKSADLIKRVPSGATVTVYDHGAIWSKVGYGSASGYMMTEYLNFGGGSDTTGDTIVVNRKALEDIYDQIGDWLGLRG